MYNFGQILKELRVAAGLSQEKLASRLQVSIKSIQRYEKNQRADTYTLVKMATFFNVSTDYLLGLKNYQEMMAEKTEKLKGIHGYNLLYSRYIKCLTEYELEEGAVYYWIRENGNRIGGQTEWVGWKDEKHEKEIRRLRPVIPENVIKLCGRTNEKIMVINNERDAEIFMIYGGNALVRKDICEYYLPEFYKEYIVKRKL